MHIGGNETYWWEGTTTYGIRWAPYPDWDAAVRSAFAEWNVASTGLQASEDPGLREHAAAGDAAHRVLYDPKSRRALDAARRRVPVR